MAAVVAGEGVVHVGSLRIAGGHERVRPNDDRTLGSGPYEMGDNVSVLTV